MEKYITIDGGTTNMRISLVCDDKIVDTKKYKVGAGENDRKALIAAIKNGIEEILSENETETNEIMRILASGMITSEAGLCELPHITAPCGSDEISAAMHETVIEEISDIPIVFSRGVKSNHDDVDVMRGEETELLGLSDVIEKNSLYVLPGSHTKLIYTDEDGRISGIMTSLTGEMISVISEGTILKNSVSLKASLNEEYLIKGYLYAREKGASFAFFRVRMLDRFFCCNEDEKYSFFIGAAIFSDIENMIRSSSERIIVGGKNELRAPIIILLEKFSDKKIIDVTDEIANNAATYGIVRMYNHYKNL